MKRVAILLVGSAAAIGVFGLAAVATADRPAKTPAAVDLRTADRPPDPSSIPPGMYTYEEAKALGIAVGPLPSETGLPTCDSSTPDPGFTSAQDADAIIRAAEEKYGEDGPNRCAADPRLGVYVVGGPVKGMPPRSNRR